MVASTLASVLPSGAKIPEAEVKSMTKIDALKRLNDFSSGMD